jgi:Effector protein
MAARQEGGDMGFWPDWKYEDYVKKNAPSTEVRILLKPESEPIDEDWPSVHVTFSPMHDWMNWYDIDLADDAFRLFLHRYRTELKNYKAKVREQFRPIPKAKTGQALLTEIERTIYFVRIKPNWDWSDPVNASATPRNSRDATARGKPVRIESERVGTGRGASSTIMYTPEMWGPNGASKIRAPAYDPDEIIYHELVHASRQMRGVQEDIRVNRGYDDMEEYLATVITNIYMSERGKTAFAGDHGTKTLKDPDKFLDNAQHVNMSPPELIRKFRNAQPEFYRDLANIGPTIAKFNPVRQFDQVARAMQRFHNIVDQAVAPV